MTQQSAVLLIAFVVGLVVAAVLLRAATRKILPRSAMAIAALAIPIWVVYFASSQGRSLLASQGFLNTMPDALWFGLTFGVFTAAFFLALGYIYGDAKRRQMPAWAWVIAASFIPNLIGFILYFLFRGPLLGPCRSCGKPIRGGEAFCSHCGCSQGSSIARITADTREKGYED
jgi:Phospholipase_D-nuclease N-terminal